LSVGFFQAVPFTATFWAFALLRERLFSSPVMTHSNPGETKLVVVFAQKAL
jgi:hypothetical protein